MDILAGTHEGVLSPIFKRCERMAAWPCANALLQGRKPDLEGFR